MASSPLPVPEAATPVTGGSTRAEVEQYLAGRPPVELRVARSMLRRSLWAGPLIIGAFGLLRGVRGAVAAGIGVVLVVGYYLAAGFLLSWLARVSLGAYHAGALFGFVARLGAMAVTMVAVATLFDVDRLALGLAVIITYAGLLVWEAAAWGNERARKRKDDASGQRQRRTATGRRTRPHG